MDEQTNKTNSSTGTNIEPNIAGALAYLISPFTGILFFVLERDNKFVRFHAMQSILLGVASYIIFTVSGMLSFLAIGLITTPILSIVFFCAWIYMMWTAYNNKEVELPVIGKIARTQINK